MNTLLKASCLALFMIAALVAAPRAARPLRPPSIEADANETLHSFVEQVPGARELANKAAGILVFPSVIKAGIGFGGEYGEGILLNQQRVVGYYNLVSASFGFQLGVQERSVIIMFMTRDALDGFDSRAGWKVGVDGSVAIITVGIGGAHRHRQGRQPGDRLHPRSEGPDVQSDARRLEDQPHQPLSSVRCQQRIGLGEILRPVDVEKGIDRPAA